MNSMSRVAELVGEADHVTITTLADNAINSSAEKKPTGRKQRKN